MKKRIVSLLLLGMYFFGGFGVVSAATKDGYLDPNNAVDAATINVLEN